MSILMSFFHIFFKNYIDFIFVCLTFPALYKKRSFPLRISSVNVTKFAVSCKFGHMTKEIYTGKLCSVTFFFGNLLIIWET